MKNINYNSKEFVTISGNQGKGMSRRGLVHLYHDIMAMDTRHVQTDGSVVVYNNGKFVDIIDKK